MATASSKTLGLTMGAVAALIGGAWQVATRHATTTHIDAIDLALLRYGIPAVLLLPVVLRAGPVPRGAGALRLVAMITGAGLPFGLVAMSGTRFAPAAHMGVLMAGASPLIAAALAWAFWQERPGPSRSTGLALMLAGVLLLGATSLVQWSTSTWRGDAHFLLAAALWAGYTLSFRRSGLTPWHAAALVNLWSAALLVAALAARGGTRLLDAPTEEILWQVAWQGLFAGVLGLWTFSVAIAHLGAARAAAFGALAPVVSALGGWIVLGDALSWLDAVAVATAVAGVALASGAFDRTPAA